MKVRKKKRLLIGLLTMIGLAATLATAVPAVADGTARMPHVRACATVQGKPACIDVWRNTAAGPRMGDFAVGYTAPNDGKYLLTVVGNRDPIGVFNGEARRGQPFGGKKIGQFFHPYPQHYRGHVFKWQKVAHRPDRWGWVKIGETPAVTIR